MTTWMKFEKQTNKLEKKILLLKSIKNRNWI